MLFSIYPSCNKIFPFNELVQSILQLLGIKKLPDLDSFLQGTISVGWCNPSFGRTERALAAAL